MSRQRLGKRERKARTSKKRGATYLPLKEENGSTEYVRLKVGHKKSGKLWRAHLKAR